MPQASNIVINDGAVTPVAHTFVPSKVSDLVATFFGPGATLATREQLVVTRREATPTVAAKVNLKVVLPIEQTVDGQIVLSHQELVSIDIITAPRSSTAQRKNARVLAANLLLNSLIASVVDDGDGIF